MSKNSHKQLYTQLMEWMPNAFKSRNKRGKSNNRQHKFNRTSANRR